VTPQILKRGYGPGGAPTVPEQGIHHTSSPNPLDQWFLTFFTYLTLFVKQGYQIYPSTFSGGKSAHLLKIWK